jgi:hypothetical protein
MKRMVHYKMLSKKYLLLLLSVALLLTVNMGIAEESGLLYVNIIETGKVISYYDEFYVVQVSGTASFYNGYNSTVFDIVVPASLPYLSLYEKDTDYFNFNSFYFLQFTPFETKELQFEIRGVTPVDPMINNMSVLRSAMFNFKPRMYAFIKTSIDKAPIEELTVNTSRVKSIKNRRLITAIIENPSNTVFNISSVKVIKTGSENITAEMKRWTFPENEQYITLGANSIWKEDIFDYNCTEGEVYWLSVDVVFDVQSYINGTHTILRFNQDELELINKTLNESEIYGNITSYLEHLLFMKKSYSKTYFVPGDTVDVDIRVNNFAPIARIINVTDFIPYGFKVISDASANFSSNTTLYWNRVVNPDSSLAIRYSLEYTDEDTLGLDYFEPAILKYTNETFYSQRVSFVRQYIPEKKIFVQKKLESSINDDYLVTIKVQNLGESTLKDLHIKEFLDEGNQFREITISPISKGLWRIPELKKNDIWEVSYITDENQALTTLPAILGVQDSVVLKTLVFEQTVRNEWIISTINIIEKIGVGIIIAIPVLLIILSMRNKPKKNPERKDGINSLNAQDIGDASLKQSRQGIKTQPTQPVATQYYQAPSSPMEEVNRKEAKENINELKKTHEQIGHKNDNMQN